MIVSRRKTTASGDRPVSTRLTKWAGFLCLGAVLAPATLVQAGAPIGFTISEGRVVPTEGFAVKVSVLGAAITASGNDIPVTVQVRINDQVLEPFGPHNDPDLGDVNDHSPPRHFVVQEVFGADTTIDVTGTSWFRGRVHLSRNSFDESPSVKVLRNGDLAPDIAGFDGQAGAVEFVQQYIDTDTGTMTMDVNQSIYLFEIGTTNLTSSAADFQDLVVLVTLGTTPAELEAGDLADAMYD